MRSAFERATRLPISAEYRPRWLAQDVHLPERQPCLLEPPGARQGVHVPEGAQREGSLVTGQSIW